MKTKMILKALTVTALVLNAPSAFAMHHEKDQAHNHAEAMMHNHEGEKIEAPEMGEHVTEATVIVHVNGLVCDFCAQAIKKVFNKQDAVESVDVNLTDKVIQLWFKEGANIEDDTLTQLITDSGYNVVSIDR